MKNKKNIIIMLLIVVIIAAIYLSTNKKNKQPEVPENERQEENIEIEYLNTVNIENQKVTTENDDEIAIKVEEKSKGIISKTIVEKNGDSSDLRLSDKMGWNSAIQVNKSSDITIEETTVKTNGSGASGIVATGNNAVIKISNSTIEIKNERSKGLLASKGGTIYADNITVTTKEFKSSAVATDFGDGTIKVTNSTIKISGEKSAGVYATGDIEVYNSSIESEQGEGAVIDGNGIITLTDVDVISNGRRAVMIYYTGPNMGETNKGRFTMNNGSVTAKGNEGFYVMNTSTEINLENVEMNLISGIFLKASVDEYGELGQEGNIVESEGGEAIVNCVNQIINGNILVDNQSTVELNLTKKSEYTGEINNANTGRKVIIKLDSNSKLTLTADSYITKLENEDTKNSNIKFNGYKLYVNGTAIN